ncbi:hypothetical protein D1007_31107 [Hordeum vulgare]|nr:hypothetical protein D1007_31107 [Hordeum vulgare]
MVYTNDPVQVEKSINTIEKLLVEDDKYNVVGDLEYSDGRARHMKVECNKDKRARQKAWVKIRDEAHLKHASKDTYTCYDIYMQIIDMRRQCLLSEYDEGSSHKQSIGVKYHKNKIIDDRFC